MADSMIYEQYQSIKSAHPNTILLMQVGDFYQAFDNDAQTLATVTACHCRQVLIGTRRVDTCGIPAAMVDAAIKALLQHGYKVAVAQPVSQPEAGKPVEHVKTGARLVCEVTP